MRNYRPTYAEINLAALEYNFREVKRKVGGKVKILAAVKADAYGHGMIEVSKRLLNLGVDYFGVATIDEAIQLRRAKIISPILVFGSILPHEVNPVINYNLTPGIGDLPTARRLNREAKVKRKKVKIHIKVDTGMGRMGIWHEQAGGFIAGLSKFKNLNLEGVYTHFANADEEDSSYTSMQIAAFQRLIEGLEREGLNIPLKHAANSMGLMKFEDSHFNLVRPGLIIYGFYPHRDMAGKVKLKPALSLKTKIVYLKKLSPGRSVSYGRTYITRRDTIIAILPLGYGDGYSRSFSNKAEVLIQGRRVPVVGTICMDQTMADVTQIPKVKVGDNVILIGKQGKEEIKVEELAGFSNTISYEVVCNISKRVPRIYKK